MEGEVPSGAEGGGMEDESTMGRRAAGDGIGCWSSGDGMVGRSALEV